MERTILNPKELKKIDAHTHIWPKEKQEMLLQWMQRSMPGYPIPVSITPEELIEDLMSQSVEKIINLVHPLDPEETGPLNRFNADLARKFENILGFASILPQNKNKEDILKHAFFDLGLMGVKIHALVQNIDLDDPEMEDVWSCCEKWERPVYFHTGFDEFYENEVVSPSHIRQILQRHPELCVVLCHSFFPRIEKGFALADEFPNVYLDITGVPISLKRVDAYKAYDRKIETTLRERLPAYAGRVLFGSDHPVGGGLVEQVYSDMYYLDLDFDLLKQLVYTNALHFMDRYKMK